MTQNHQAVPQWMAKQFVWQFKFIHAAAQPTAAQAHQAVQVCPAALQTVVPA